LHYVIIGNSTAAVGAVEGIRSIDPRSPITLISEEPYHTYSRPLISYYLAGKVIEEQMVYRPVNFYRDNKVGIFLGRRATNLDVESKKVTLEGGMTVSYDRLLLATGGKPFLPQIEGLTKKNVFTFTKWDDVKKIKETALPGNKAVVIGGGLIGLKAAESLSLIGAEVTVVELADRILSTILDTEAAPMVQEKLEERGIKFQLGTTASSILGEDTVEEVILNNGVKLQCNLLIFAIGVIPNADLVKNTPIKTNRGILVNEYMSTSVKDVYAAGDVAEGYDLLHKENRLLPIIPNAYKQGEVAGLNMANCITKFAGGFAMNSISFFGFPMITAGLQAETDSDGIEVLVRVCREKRAYRKVILRDNRVVGFILLNNIDRAGILTGLLKEQVDVGSFKDKLLMEDFGHVYFPKTVRREKLLGGTDNG